MADKRKTKDRVILKAGECEVKSRKLFVYRWTDTNHKRHAVYAPTLKALRDKEANISKDKLDKIDPSGMYQTVNDVYELWCDLKRGLKGNTFSNYKYMYNTYVYPSKFGHMKISRVKKSDVKAFYNNLKDSHSLKNSTIEGIHTVVHQVLQQATDDDLIRNNPSDNVLREFKKAHNNDSERRKALTAEEERRFLEYLKATPKYSHWYPIFLVMIRTGMRVGECTGLRWRDIDFDEGTININHTLVYYAHELSNGCYFAINSTKTVASQRIIPMSAEVKAAFLQEKAYQEELGLQSQSVVDGYRDFIFINRFGECQHGGTLNKALVRIIRDCNDDAMNKENKDQVLLPHFSCHSLRHTFTTRMVEAGLNPKFVQDVLGHADISTTMNIYADCTKQMKQDAMQKLTEFYEKLQEDK